MYDQMNLLGNFCVHVHGKFILENRVEEKQERLLVLKVLENLSN